MIVRESTSSITTTTAGTTLAANVSRKKLIVTNASDVPVDLNFSGNAITTNVYDQRIAGRTSVVVENYTGECRSSGSLRYVEFT
jgi:hypothetical protein